MKIYIDGKPLEETIWEFDGHQYPGDKALYVMTMGSPLFLPVMLGSALVGGLIGHRIGKRRKIKK